MAGKVTPMSKTVHVLRAHGEFVEDTIHSVTVDLSQLLSAKLGRNILQGQVFRVKYLNMTCTNDDGGDPAGFTPLGNSEGYGFCQTVVPTKYNVNAWQQMKDTWLEQQRELVPLPGGFREFAIGYFDSNPEVYMDAASTPINPVLKNTLRALKVVESAASPVVYNDHSLFLTGDTNDTNDSTAILDNYDEEHQILVARVKDQDGVTIYSNKYQALAGDSIQRMYFATNQPGFSQIVSATAGACNNMFINAPANSSFDQVTGLLSVSFKTLNKNGDTHPSEVNLEVGVEGWTIIK